MDWRDTSARRTAVLPGRCRIVCDLAVPYEAMVWLGLEEDHDLRVVRRLLRPGQTFIDCGANIGLWSLVAAPLVGPTGRVLAFEPNPTTAAKLAANVAANRLGNVTVAPVAVGAAAGRVSLRCDDAHNLSAVVDQPSQGSVEVPVVTLDDSVMGGSVHGVKIDVEGFELEVLHGAERVISKPGVWLCVEFNTVASGVPVLGKWDVHHYLTRRGFSARLMCDALRAQSVPPLPDGWGPSGYCNLFYSTDIAPAR